MRTARASKRVVLCPVSYHRAPFPAAVTDAAAPPDGALRRRRDPERIELAVSRRVPLLQQVRAHDRERTFPANLGAAIALDRRRDRSPPPAGRASAPRERAVVRRGFPCVPALAAAPPDLQTRVLTDRVRIEVAVVGWVPLVHQLRVEHRERAPSLNA